LLVEPNSAAEIASACEQLIQDPLLRKRIGEEGYLSFQKNYTWRSIHQHYREVIEALPA
jgi:glycosyltransferase involved in cell wall biosynthesis